MTIAEQYIKHYMGHFIKSLVVPGRRSLPTTKINFCHQKTYHIRFHYEKIVVVLIFMAIMQRHLMVSGINKYIIPTYSKEKYIFIHQISL